MTLLHDAYTALLSGLTTKTGNEIHWEDEYGIPITVEPIDIGKEKYIIRYYYLNGSKQYETECQGGLRHGKCIRWYENGNKELEIEFQNGQRHGKFILCHENGDSCYEDEYRNGKPAK